MKLFSDVVFKSLDVSSNFVLIERENDAFYLDFWRKYS